jgi:alcohol dehydrogenase
MNRHAANSMIGFDYQPRTRVAFGQDTVESIGEHAAGWSARRVLIVTDGHIAEAGHADRARRALEAAGMRVSIYDRVRENPTTDDVEDCVAFARSAEADTLIGLGGGSSMDTAKGCNFILTNGGSMRDYWGVGKATKPMLPMIAAPTTAGTGSECQAFALIADAETHRKMACGDPKAAARVAILDPTLTTTQPRAVTANTGVDAITHAVETAVTNQRNELSLMYAREAFRLTRDHFAEVLDRPEDVEARGGMLLGAAFAGTAIANSMLGAAHAAANPLTAHYGVIHGQAVGLMLPAVVRFNAEDPTARGLYAELAAHARLVAPETGADEAVTTLLGRIEALLDAAGIPRSLGELGIPREAIPTLAEDATKEWTARFNPRAITSEDFARLYESLLTRPDTAAAAP